MAQQPSHAAMQNEEDNKFDQRVLSIDRVARVVKGGRRFRFRALVAVGDKEGSVGVGSAKGADVTAAITKASEIAKKSMVKIPMSGTTIPHEITAKVGGSKILIMPAGEGTGLISGSVTRQILEAAGVGNIVSKSLGSANKTNTAYAVIEALQTIVPKEDWITTKVRAAAKAGKK